MATKPRAFRIKGRLDAQQAEREYDRQRDKQSWRKWYKTYRWQKARAEFLSDPENQFCVRCRATGLLNAGTFHMDGTLQTNSRRMHLVVDHIEKHYGIEAKFWDRSNWQPLCPDHHDIAKQAEERRPSFR